MRIKPLKLKEIANDYAFIKYNIAISAIISEYIFCGKQHVAHLDIFMSIPNLVTRKWTPKQGLFQFVITSLPVRVATAERSFSTL